MKNAKTNKVSGLLFCKTLKWAHEIIPSPPQIKSQSKMSSSFFIVNYKCSSNPNPNKIPV